MRNRKFPCCGLGETSRTTYNMFTQIHHGETCLIHRNQIWLPIYYLQLLFDTCKLLYFLIKQEKIFELFFTWTISRLSKNTIVAAKFPGKS